MIFLMYICYVHSRESYVLPKQWMCGYSCALWHCIVGQWKTRIAHFSGFYCKYGCFCDLCDSKLLQLITRIALLKTQRILFYIVLLQSFGMDYENRTSYQFGCDADVFQPRIAWIWILLECYKEDFVSFDAYVILETWRQIFCSGVFNNHLYTDGVHVFM